MTSGRAQVYIGLGSNLGDRLKNLQSAVAAMDRSGLQIVARSSVYETDPVGPAGQPDYLNAVVEVRTELKPEEVLREAKAIEIEMGRLPGERWGPRPVDLDLLLYDSLELSTDRLTIPHPQVRNRAFVLVPLAEIAPGVRLDGNETVAQLKQAIEPIEGVRLFRKARAW